MTQVGARPHKASGGANAQESSEKALGTALQDARKAAGLTQQELCQRSGLSYSTLAKIERGAIKSPSIFTIQSIAEALGTDLNGLIGVSSPQKPAKKVTKTGVSFIYFDINGCLVRFFHRAFTKLAHDANASPDTVETTFWHYNDAVCRGEMTMSEFNAVLAKQLKIDSIDWMKYYLASVDPIMEMHELVTWASQQYNIGLLSNIMPGFVSAMLNVGLLPDAGYQQIIDSSAVGAIKPETSIYEIAAQKAGVPPEQILLVDDSRTNLMAAERLGWRVLWFDDYRPDESAARVRSSIEPAD